MYCNGRRKILTDVQYIDSSNILDVLGDAMKKHQINRAEIEYLYDYYRGITPVYRKTKEVRENINHKINVNRAFEIISFKLGYGYGEPIKYVSRADGSSDKVELLNSLMDYNDKLRKDSELAMWGLICGTGYRLVIPSTDEETPFEVYTLHPSTTFVIYRNDVKQQPMCAVTFVENEKTRQKKYTVYTEDKVYDIDYVGNITESVNFIGIPIIEYPFNEARLGAFEPVLDILDAISEVESNRLDDVEQYVNSFMALIGGQIDEETYNNLNEYKMLCLPDGVDIKYLSSQMHQTDIQVLVDAMYETVLVIAGVPSRNSSAGDTRGAAASINSGWSNCETQAKTNEQFFSSSERKFLKVVLEICKDCGVVLLPISQIDIKFSRHNTENLVSKTQALATMINTGISPKVAIATSELWSDPNDVWNESKETFERKAVPEVETIKEEDNVQPMERDTNSVPTA